MLIDLSGWALRRARITSSSAWLRVFDVLRAVELALAGLPIRVTDPKKADHG